MKSLAFALALLPALVTAQPNLVTLKCVRDTDIEMGLVHVNTSSNVVTIGPEHYTATVDGSGIISFGALHTPGRFLRINRFNGVVMARWRPTTPAGTVDYAAVCDVYARKF